MKNPSLTLASAIILRVVREGTVTDSKSWKLRACLSGTMYPALQRLEDAWLIRAPYRESAELRSRARLAGLSALPRKGKGARSP